MADHVRRQLRDAVAAAVTGLATSGARVYTESARIMQDQHLPGLKIYTGDEAGEDETIHSPSVRARTVELVVECVAKAESGMDDTLDQMALEVEQALASGVTVDGQPVALPYDGLESRSTGEPEQFTGSLALRFNVSLRNLADAPDVLI